MWIIFKNLEFKLKKRFFLNLFVRDSKVRFFSDSIRGVEKIAFVDKPKYYVVLLLKD
jgi:hypothetical protein